jgi:hypothetical protein
VKKRCETHPTVTRSQPKYDILPQTLVSYGNPPNFTSSPQNTRRYYGVTANRGLRTLTFLHPKHIATREDKLSEQRVHIHGT